MIEKFLLPSNTFDVASPDLLNGPLPVAADGALELKGAWLPGLPSDLQLYLRFWWADAGGPKGFAASRGAAGDAALIAPPRPMT